MVWDQEEDPTGPPPPVKKPALENRTRETPVGHLRIEEEGGPCKNEVLGMCPGWPLCHELPGKKVLVLWETRKPEKNALLGI